jgi:HAD superfamily hydrolase (TIGR01509 family)
MSRFDLVIFDCDGVLVDSERIAIRIDVIALRSIGWEITEEEVIERFVGKSDAMMTREVEAHTGRKLEHGWDAAFAPLYREALERDLVVVDGIVEALDAIQPRVPTCVASSGTHKKMDLTLGKTGLRSRFEGRIFSATEVAHGKPAPDLFLHAAERMGFAPARCAVIEDSRFGVEAALAAGMTPFAYTGGVTPAARLALPGAIPFADMRALPSLVL